MVQFSFSAEAENAAHRLGDHMFLVRMNDADVNPAGRHGNHALIPRVLSTAASRLGRLLSTGGRGQKLLPAVVAAKVESLSIAFGVESGCFVHGHSADGVFGHGFRFFYGHFSFLVVVVTVF
jgi:hypothetical protein